MQKIQELQNTTLAQCKEQMLQAGGRGGHFMGPRNAMGYGCQYDQDCSGGRMA
jgi:hypothetical protein